MCVVELRNFEGSPERQIVQLGLFLLTETLRLLGLVRGDPRETQIGLG